MNMPKTMAMKAISRGSENSRSTVPPGGRPVIRRRRPWSAYRRRRRRTCRRATAGWRGRREADAHGEALGDLGEIAGRVFGRQQREFGARSRRDALDHAFDRVAVIGVDADRRLLAGSQPVELGFLEIGVDVIAVVRGHRHQARAGLDELAGLDDPVADRALERRLDFREAEVALGPRQRDRELRAHALGLLNLGLQHHEIGLRAGKLRLRPGESRIGLVAVGKRLVVALFGGEQRGGQRTHASPIALGAGLLGPRGVDLGLRLGDDGRLRLRLGLDPDDGGVLGLDLVPRRVDRELVIAGIDPREQLAGLDVLVVDDRDLFDIARNLGRDDREIGMHIGVVGRINETPDRDIMRQRRAAIGEPANGGDSEQPVFRTARAARRGHVRHSLVPIILGRNGFRLGKNGSRLQPRQIVGLEPRFVPLGRDAVHAEGLAARRVFPGAADGFAHLILETDARVKAQLGETPEMTFVPPRRSARRRQSAAKNAACRKFGPLVRASTNLAQKAE